MYVTGEELQRIVESHQKATETSHAEMLGIMCNIFAETVRLGHSYISNRIVEALERVPGDMS